MSKMTADRTAATELTGDAAQVCAVLAWARDTGLQIASLTVGACHVELRHAAPPAGEQRPAPRRNGIYDDAMAQSPELKALLAETGIPDGELQPAVGRR